MILRSWLFVPGDSERKLAKSLDVGADALILDLEDAVLSERRDYARGLVSEFISSTTTASDVWVRVNPLGSLDVDADLRMLGNTDVCGVMLPKAAGPDEVVRLREALLSVWGGGSEPRILPIATETPTGFFALGDYGRRRPAGLYGLTWGAEDLAAELGVLTNQDLQGQWTGPFELARSLCLMAARYAGVEPIDTLFANFKDPDGLNESCRLARRDGFTGKLAIHPDQVPIINASFTPGADEVQHALRVVQLFRDNPGAGALSLDGKLVDRPHLRQAERLVALVERLGGARQGG
jgi:citrate lyase subunit beta/citryl-CoA lyase